MRSARIGNRGAARRRKRAMTQNDHGRAARLPADLRRRRRHDGDRLRPARRHAQPARRRSRGAEGDRQRRARRRPRPTSPAISPSQASCVLVDPVCAVPQLVDDGVLDRRTALLIGLDASGWDVSPEGYRLSKLVEGVDRPPRARARRHRRQDHDLPALRHAGGERRTTSRSSTGWSPTSRGRTCCSSSSS